MSRRWRRPRRRSELGSIGLCVFALAFAVRAWWALTIQRPIDAVWSDMAGYVLRAEQLLAGTVPGDPRIDTLWPWGTHTILAGEIALFGRHSVVGIALCHAAVGAIAAPCASALTARCVRRRPRLAALLAGLLVAIWQPHFVYSGYFASEIWFTSASLLATVFLVRYSEGRGGALPAGICLGLSFVLRPQILLTALLVALVLGLVWLRGKDWIPRSRRGVVMLLAPLLVMIGVSAVRLHHLTGRWGLISSNEPVQRVFGGTDVVRLEAHWTAPNGDRWTWWLNRATGEAATPSKIENFEGFIADPDIMNAIYVRRLANVGIGTRLRRRVDNVLCLLRQEITWPESQATTPMRRKLQKTYASALFVVLAYALFGLWPLRRHRVVCLAVMAHLATLVFLAANYYGEPRYRVPYDPLLVVLATVGLWALFDFVASFSERANSR